MSELDKAMFDLTNFGSCFMLDGKHVPLKDVIIDPAGKILHVGFDPAKQGAEITSYFNTVTKTINDHLGGAVVEKIEWNEHFTKVPGLHERLDNLADRPPIGDPDGTYFVPVEEMFADVIEKDNTRQYIVNREAYIINLESVRQDAMDRYFNARPALARSHENQRIFEAGFHMAWEHLDPERKQP